MDKIIFLLPAAAFAAVFFLILFLKQRGMRRKAEKELFVQQKRVMDRKKKIAELRNRIAELNCQISEDEKMLQDSFSPEEVQKKYESLSAELSRITAAIRDSSLEEAEKNELTGRVENFAEEMAHAFRISVKNDKDGNAAEESDGYAGSRILVVDDNIDNIRNITDMLENRGILTDSAQSGEEALEKFEKSREGYYSMIIMDIVMEGMRGYEAAKRIRDMYRSDSNQIPIVAVTANSFAEDMILIQNSGMNERIVKPVTETKLFDVIKKWIGVPEYMQTQTSHADNQKWKSLVAS